MLREGKIYTEKFRKLVPALSAHFNGSMKQIGELLRALQPATRLLHTLCNHYKSQKEATLVALIPPVKRSLEQLLYAVKGILESHNLGEHFKVSSPEWLM